jgi:Integrase zinc binding domain
VVYLFKAIRKPLVKELYKEPSKGHLRIKRTKDAVAARYYFPSILKMVERIVKECDLC